MKITRRNIKNFIEGNARLIKANLGMGKPHLIEQVAYRESKCLECSKVGHCLGPNCDCSVPGRWFVDRTCNEKKFPDLMEEELWQEYKKHKGIEIEK